MPHAKPQSRKDRVESRVYLSFTSSPASLRVSLGSCPSLRSSALVKFAEEERIWATPKARPLLRVVRILCVVSVSLCVLCGEKVLAQGSKKPPEKPPPVERITENVYRIGSALVDTAARTIVCPAEINMDEGPIEYLAVAPKGKLHESLLRVDVRPLHLQVALLMLDLEPKNVLKAQGDKTTPQGDPVELRIRWRDEKGVQQDVRAEELVAEMPNEKVMAKHDWVFTGSRIVKEIGFEADVSKSLVAVWHDPSAILDNPLPGGGDNGYIVNTKRVPRRGTRVDFVLKAVAAPPKPDAVKPAAKGRP